MHLDGVESSGYTEEWNRMATAIYRSQYEFYSFTTKNNLSEERVNGLLEFINVSSCAQHVSSKLLYYFKLLSRNITYYYMF